MSIEGSDNPKGFRKSLDSSIEDRSDHCLMDNLADDEHCPVSLADIKKRFDGVELLPFGGWPSAGKI